MVLDKFDHIAYSTHMDNANTTAAMTKTYVLRYTDATNGNSYTWSCTATSATEAVAKLKAAKQTVGLIYARDL